MNYLCKLLTYGHQICAEWIYYTNAPRQIHFMFDLLFKVTEANM